MKIKIPMVSVNLIILLGNGGLKKFKEEINKHSNAISWEPEKTAIGYHAENYIWLQNYQRKTLIHELSHFLNWLYEYLQCEKESEFKAFLSEYVIDSTLKYFEKVRDK